MTDASQIREILAQYEKYGWKLERILLTGNLRERVFAEMEKELQTAEIISSEIDAAWFSRTAKNGGETWELRHLSANPYALLEVFDEDDDDNVREETLMEIEEKLKATLTTKKQKSH